MNAVPPWPAAFLADWIRPDGAPWTQAFAGAVDGWQALLEACTDETLRAMGPWRSFWQFGKALSAYHERQPELSVAQAVDCFLEDFLGGVELAASAEAALVAGLPPAPDPGPAFGPWREWQKLGTALTAALRAERETGARLRLRQWQALRAGAERLRKRLQEDDGSIPQMTSLSGLYDVFVDHLEEAYQAEMKTSAYSEAFGVQVNAGLRLRDTISQLAEKTMTHFGLPTPADLRAIAARLGALEASAREQATAASAARPRAAAPAQAASAVSTPGGAQARPKPKTSKPQASAVTRVPAPRSTPATKPERRRAAADFDIGGVVSTRRERP